VSPGTQQGLFYDFSLRGCSESPAGRDRIARGVSPEGAPDQPRLPPQPRATPGWGGQPGWKGWNGCVVGSRADAPSYTIPPPFGARRLHRQPLSRKEKLMGALAGLIPTPRSLLALYRAMFSRKGTRWRPSWMRWTVWQVTYWAPDLLLLGPSWPWGGGTAFSPNERGDRPAARPGTAPPPAFRTRWPLPRDGRPRRRIRRQAPADAAAGPRASPPAIPPGDGASAIPIIERGARATLPSVPRVRVARPLATQPEHSLEWPFD